MGSKTTFNWRGWLGALTGCVVVDIGFRCFGLFGSVGALVVFAGALSVLHYSKQRRLERLYLNFKTSNAQQKRRLVISSDAEVIEYFEQRAKSDGLNWDSMCSGT